MMNDKEIIKALECCMAGGTCEDCPYYTNEHYTCGAHLNKDILDLINRQQAEIKALTGRTAKQEATIERLEDVKEQLESDIINANMNLEHMTAEIERLQNLTEKDFEQTAISTVKRHQKWIKYRAIKEFAKKIRQKISAMVCSPDLLTLDDYDKCIDDVLKEMVGDAE